jgi:hypothetical protein
VNSNDSEARRQLARERAEELAREVRLARGPAELRSPRPRARRALSGLGSLLGLPRAPRRDPAYRS